MRGALVLGTALCLSCSSAGARGGDVEVGIFAVDSEGREGVVDCVVLPVLGGGRVQSTVIVDDILAVRADATREEVILRFENEPSGDELARPRQLGRALLSSGHAEELEISPRPNLTYTIFLSSECIE